MLLPLKRSIHSPIFWSQNLLTQSLWSVSSPSFYFSLSIRRILGQYWYPWILTENWRFTPNRTWTGTEESTSMRSHLTCECKVCVYVCHSHENPWEHSANSPSVTHFPVDSGDWNMHTTFQLHAHTNFKAFPTPILFQAQYRSELCGWQHNCNI